MAILFFLDNAMVLPSLTLVESYAKVGGTGLYKQIVGGKLFCVSVRIIILCGHVCILTLNPLSCFVCVGLTVESI